MINSKGGEKKIKIEDKNVCSQNKSSVGSALVKIHNRELPVEASERETGRRSNQFSGGL